MKYGEVQVSIYVHSKHMSSTSIIKEFFFDETMIIYKGDIGEPIAKNGGPNREYSYVSLSHLKKQVREELGVTDVESQVKCLLLRLSNSLPLVEKAVADGSVWVQAVIEWFLYNGYSPSFDLAPASVEELGRLKSSIHMHVYSD